MLFNPKTMAKKTEDLLPLAPGYTYVGVNRANRFTRGSSIYRLDRMTDEDIAKLLEAEPVYWSTHFKATKKSPKPKGEGEES